MRLTIVWRVLSLVTLTLALSGQGLAEGQRDQKIGGLRDELGEGFRGVNKRLDSLQQALAGESVLGRYAAAEVEERERGERERIIVWSANAWPLHAFRRRQLQQHFVHW